MNKLKKVAVICVATVCLACNNVFAETKEINTATRVRKSASTDSNIVTVLYPGNDVEVLGQEGEWSKVQRGDYVGYVKTEFLKKLEDKDNESEIYNTVKKEVKNTVKNETKTETKNEVKNTIVENKVVENKVENIVKNEVTNTTNNTNNTVISDTLETLEKGKIAILIKTELNVMPNFFSNSIIELDAGKVLTILDEINNWYKVVTEDGKEGWILKSKTTNKVLNVEKPVKETDKNVDSVEKDTTEKRKTQTETKDVTNKKGIVNVETANIREKASTTAKRVGFLDYNDEVVILSEENGFYKITSTKIDGYVSKTLITVTDEKVSSRSLAEERKEEVLRKEEERKKQEESVSKNENNTEVVENVNTLSNNTTAEYSLNGESVVSYAKQFLGMSYVLGGKTPETGFDCAGFTKYVYKNFGYTLGTIASAQTTVGTDVTSMADLKVGDLVLFQNEEKTKIGHTGVYMGNGEFIHAANPERGVVIDNLNTSSYYNTRFVIAKRIVD